MTTLEEIALKQAINQIGDLFERIEDTRKFYEESPDAVDWRSRLGYMRNDLNKVRESINAVLNHQPESRK